MLLEFRTYVQGFCGLRALGHSNLDICFADIIYASFGVFLGVAGFHLYEFFGLVA